MKCIQKPEDGFNNAVHGKIFHFMCLLVVHMMETRKAASFHCQSEVKYVDDYSTSRVLGEVPAYSVGSE